MNQILPVAVLAVLTAVVPACRAPDEPPRTHDAAPTVDAPRSAVVVERARSSAAANDALRRRVEADRLALEVAEAHLAQRRSLAAAGRVTDTDLLADELAVLKLRDRLQRSERALEDARRGAAAGDRSRPAERR
jgi:hypothetical protein